MRDLSFDVASGETESEAERTAMKEAILDAMAVGAPTTATV